MLKYLKFAFLIHSIFWFSALYGQKYPFVLYDEDKGLFQKYIYHISQDLNNNILLSTSDGFMVFNGSGFRLINSSISSSESFVTTHYLSKKGNLYLGYKDGRIEIFSKEYLKLSNYKDIIHSPISKFVELDERIIIATNGNGLWELSNNKLSKVTGVTSKSIYDIALENEKIIVAGDSGVEELILKGDKKSEQVGVFKGATILKILGLGKGRFASLNEDGSVIIADLKYQGKILCKLKNPFNSTFKFTSICFEDSLTFYVGSLGGGIVKIHFMNTAFTHYDITGFNINNNLPSNNVQSLYIDNNKGLWIGTFGSGLSYLYTDNILYFEDDTKRPTLSMCEIDAHSVLVGTNKGLFIQDNSSERKNHSFFEILNDQEINALYKDEGGLIWIGTESKGLYTYNHGKKLLLKPQEGYKISTRDVQCITGNGNGIIYVGTYDGLFEIDKKREITTKYTTNNGLAHNYILDIACDNKNNLWIVSPQAGLQRFNSGKFKLYNTNSGLESLNITSICLDLGGNIWFCTDGDGVFSYNGKQFYHYTTKNGLVSNFCYGITGDKKEQIFVKHKNSISVKSNSKMNFSQLNIQKLDLTFKNKCLFTAEDNSTLFGTENGRLKIKDHSINSISPELHLNTVQVNGEVKDNGLLQNLSYNENDIKIDFNCTYYPSLEKITYKYKFIGYDTSWNYLPNKSNSIFFKKVPPGNYTLLLQALADGENSSKLIELQLTIQKPFWSKWWFYLLILLAIVLSTVLYVKIKNKNILLKNLRLEKTVGERTVELKKKNDQISAILKSKELFFANINHEIRTPFNAVIGFSELLMETKLTRQQIDYVKTINTSADGLVRLINDLLELSRLEAGKIAFLHKPFKLTNTIEDVIKTVSFKAVSNNVKIITGIDKSTPDILIGDDFRVKQILLNLISNAVKFTKNGGVSISVQLHEIIENEVKLKITIIDEGIGMDEEKLRTIFNSFTQADPSIAKAYGGTGLGLAITKNIVEQLGGSISVNSKLGIGSTFTCLIPFQRPVPGDKYSLDIVNENDELTDRILKLNILLADDQMVNRILLEKWLLKWQCKVESFENGLDLVNAIKKDDKWDVILLDLQMPILDGFETALKLKKEMGIKIPIIAITGEISGEIIDKCHSFGMNGHISKPFRSSELFEAIKNAKNNLSEFKNVNSDYVEESNKGYSLKYLNEEYSNDKDFLKEILNIMLYSCDDFMIELNRSIISKDKHGIKKVIHKIKPTIEMLHITKMKDVLEKIEIICKNQHSKENLKPFYKELEIIYYEIKPKIIIEVEQTIM